MKRIHTGIPGFDELTEGGFPERSNILINGEPGTGKTIFGLQYLALGASQYNEKGLYLSFEQSKESLIEQARQFGLDLTGVSIEFLSPSKVKSVEHVLKVIFDQELKTQIKRVVIDSLPALYINTAKRIHNSENNEELDEEGFIYRLLDDMSKMSITTLIVSEEGNTGLNYIAQYVCDGVINLGVDAVDGFSRSIYIRKMRLTKKDDEVHPFEIGEKGISVTIL